MVVPPRATTAAEVRSEIGLCWWREVVGLAAMYAAYSICRNWFGSGAVSPTVAAVNADRVMDLETALGLFHEQAVQRWFLSLGPLIKAVNVFYGTAHFLVPALVLISLYRWHPDEYRRWRNVLIVTTGASLCIFCLFPLMPPRLLADCGPYGACLNSPFVDTLHRFGGVWSFESTPMVSVSNQFAAMPSLHFAWALWCALAARPLVRRRLSRRALSAYPFATLLTIVVTGNHYFLDAAVAGVLVGVALLSTRRSLHVALAGMVWVSLRPWVPSVRSPGGTAPCDPTRRRRHGSDRVADQTSRTSGADTKHDARGAGRRHTHPVRDEG